MNFYNNDVGLDFKDVLIVPRNSKVQSRKDVNLEVICLKHGTEWKGIPVVGANMDTIGTFKTAAVLSEFKMPTFLHKFYTLEDFKTHDYNSEYIGVSSGISPKEIVNLLEILKYNPSIRFVCIDVANGYLNSIDETVALLASHVLLHGKFLVVGNVVTKKRANELIMLGADIVKVGIGSGSVCLTRKVAGVGFPQLSAIDDCSGSPIMSDGGCTSSGDISKAFIAGARFVMLAGMLAGHNETGDDFYGMASSTAMSKYGGSGDYKTSEGKHVILQSRGHLKDTIENILGGIRSTCTYVGCGSLGNIIKNPEIQFIKVNRQLNEVFA